MTARDVMTPDPVVVDSRASVAEVIELMRDLDVRHLPVVEGGSLVGMVSDRDLAAFDVARLLTVEGAEAVRSELGTPVARIMSANVVAVDGETDLREIVDLLLEHRIGAIPVIDPDGGRVIGIVSYIDVLRAMRRMAER